MHGFPPRPAPQQPNHPPGPGDGHYLQHIIAAHAAAVIDQSQAAAEHRKAGEILATATNELFAVWWTLWDQKIVIRTHETNLDQHVGGTREQKATELQQLKEKRAELAGHRDDLTSRCHKAFIQYKLGENSLINKMDACRAIALERQIAETGQLASHSPPEAYPLASASTNSYNTLTQLVGDLEFLVPFEDFDCERRLIDEKCPHGIHMIPRSSWLHITSRIRHLARTVYLGQRATELLRDLSLDLDFLPGLKIAVRAISGVSRGERDLEANAMETEQ